MMELFVERNPGARLLALLEAQKSIAALYEPWVQGEKIDRDRLRALHDTATVAAHRYYVESIPVYRKLAEELGLVECDDSETIRAELASTDHLFKSYPQEWIEARDFESMTEWVRQITPSRARPKLEDIETIEQWLAAMHEAGWILRFSSGTSGHLSFVPREALTDRSLMHFTIRQWVQMAGRKPLPLNEFDGYFMVFAGGYQTISAQGAMLGKLCRSATFMYPEASNADLLRLGGQGTANRGRGSGADLVPGAHGRPDGRALRPYPRRHARLGQGGAAHPALRAALPAARSVRTDGGARRTNPAAAAGLADDGRWLEVVREPAHCARGAARVRA